MSSQPMNKIVLREKFALFTDYWSPRIVAEINDQYVKLAKLKGEMVWHSHANEDEFFLVVEGRLTLKFRDREVVLEKGECLVVPAGVEHLPVAEEETHVVLIEKKTTLHTGTVRSELTVDIEDQKRI